LPPSPTPPPSLLTTPPGAAKLSKGAKKRAKAQQEAALRAAEAARLSGASSPTSAADYERLLLSHPDSSYTWIKYMAFCMSLGEVEKARGVAQRALDTINIREQGEKFNVWVAWLNLEAVYGSPTPEAAVSELFQKALQYTDQKKLYLALLDILQRGSGGGAAAAAGGSSSSGGRGQLVEEVLKTVTKKFSGSAKVRGGVLAHSRERAADGVEAVTWFVCDSSSSCSDIKPGCWERFVVCGVEVQA
jgi:rRNA biogenesis protein RRP5